MNKIPATVEIMTRNNAATLPRALESIKDFAEIIIIDGGSTDETRTIAESYGARVIDQDPQFLDKGGRIRDFAAIRNQGFAASAQSWFFFLDSDEYASPELITAIRRTIGEGAKDGYWVRRKYVVNGRVIDSAYSYPNRSMRLVAKESAEGFIKQVHERIKLKEGSAIGEIIEPIYVPLDADAKAGRDKINRYIEVQLAQEGDISWRALLGITYDTLRACAIYALRECKVLCFGRGNRLPLAFALETERYHMRVLRRFWGEKLRRTFHAYA